MKYAPTIAGIVLGLLFVMSAVTVLFNLVPMPELPKDTPISHFMAAFGPTGYMKFVKVCELLGGILVAIPRTRNLGLLLSKHRGPRGKLNSYSRWMKYAYHRWCHEREENQPDAADAVPALASKLGSSDVSLRREAARALGRVGPGASGAVSALVSALSDKDKFVRREAALALGKIGPSAREAAGALQKAAKDSEMLVAQAAQGALQAIGN